MLPPIYTFGSLRPHPPLGKGSKMHYPAQFSLRELLLGLFPYYKYSLYFEKTNKNMFSFDFVCGTFTLLATFIFVIYCRISEVSNPIPSLRKAPIMYYPGTIFRFDNIYFNRFLLSG